MLLLVLILVLIAFALLVVALLSGSVLSAWLAVGVSVLAGVVLVFDWLQRRAAVKAGSDPAPAPTVSTGGDIDPVTEVFAIHPGRSTLPAVGDGQATSTPLPDEAESQQTMILPVIRPSGSDSRPSGAQPGATPPGVFSSPGVTSWADEPTRSDASEARDGPLRDGRSEAEQTVVVDALRPKGAQGADVPADPDGSDSSEISDGSAARTGPPEATTPGETDDVPAADPTSVGAARVGGGSSAYGRSTNGAVAGRDLSATGAAGGGVAAGPGAPALPGSEFMGLVNAARSDSSTRPPGSGAAGSHEARQPDGREPDGREPGGETVTSGHGETDPWSRLSSGGAAIDGSTVTDLPSVRSTGEGAGVDLAKPMTDPAPDASQNGAVVDTPPVSDGDTGTDVHGSVAQPVETPSAPALEGDDAVTQHPDGSVHAEPASAGLSDAGSSSVVGDAFSTQADGSAGAISSSAPPPPDAVEPPAGGAASTMTYDESDYAEPPEESPDAAVVRIVSGLEDEVLVIDERPRYHLAGCRAVLAEAVIPLPAREAVDLGFTPCGLCSPDATLADRHRADVRH